MNRYRDAPIKMHLLRSRVLAHQYHVQCQVYQRPFSQPLRTSHGIWEVREGIILQLKDRFGNLGWGEIAPLPWFGSETLTQAQDYCHSLQGVIQLNQIEAIPDCLPACQFAFESALADLQSPIRATSPDWLADRPNFCVLLPNGEQALQAWQGAWQQGKTTFKWKIGLGAIAQELSLFQQLVTQLPPSAKLRLDANGGLNIAEMQQWLQVLAPVPLVEYLEQPLPPEQFPSLLELEARYPTAIALDESVATLKQLRTCYDRGWRGIFIIKAAIAGSPSRLKQFSIDKNLDLVFSSVLETPIARTAALRLAQTLSNPQRALGFGIENWFIDREEQWLTQIKQTFR